MKAATDTSDRDQLQRHLDAHMRCAETNPRKREQHLKAAEYYAQLLGVERPNLAFTVESWVNGNPARFFVDSENRRRRCSLCGKCIAAGEQYFGMSGMNLALLRSGLPSVRIKEKRLHRACAESIK